MLSRTKQVTPLLMVGLSLMLVMSAVLGLSITAAQETTPPPEPPTATPAPIVVTGTTPSQIFTGQSGILTITGGNFRTTTTVNLIGVGALPATLISGNELRAAIPGNLTAGQYIIQVSDSQGGSNSSFTLTVITPPTAVPPTDPPPIPTAIPQPTEIPGSPALVVRSFTASPSTIRPGDTTTFTLDIVNQGSRVAQSVSVAVNTGGKFIPANGQSAVVLPDLGVNSTYSVRLSVVAASDTPDGPQTVALTLSYRDFSGQSYTSAASLTVNVDAVPQASQVTLARYQFNPSPVIPGEPVTVTVLLTNSGNETASQVLVSVATDGILLAGPQGNSFPVGDIAPGESTSVDMPLIVSNSAKAGPQSQNLTINFLQKGEAQNITASMTINIAKVETPAPVMLIDSFSTGYEFLRPGQEFTLTLNLKNIGTDKAEGLVITFGGVESSGTAPDPTPGSGGSSTTTTPSNTFAPLDSVGTQYIGTIEASDEVITVTQKFIVNGSVDSGLYSLPITLRYQRSDGAAVQDNLRASLPVILPPQLRINETSPLPEQGNMGETYPLSLEIANQGTKPVNFTTAVITAENADILSESELYLGPVRNDDQTTFEAIVMPNAVGKVTVTVTLNYTDALSRPQSIVRTYEMDAQEPPPMPEVVPPIDIGPQPDNGSESISSRDLLGRLLLGLLGLGS